MNGDNDNGYHSCDDAETPEVDMFQDLNYNGSEAHLNEPDYDALRKGRFERNQNAMESLNSHIAHLMPYSKSPEKLTSEDVAAIVIQKYIRAHLARKKYIELLVEHFEKEERVRREKTMEQVEEAKLLIQNHLLEVQFEEYNVIRKNKAQRLACSAITIQRAWRKYSLGKRGVNGMAQEEIDDNELEMLATQLSEAALQSALSELLLLEEKCSY